MRELPFPVDPPSPETQAALNELTAGRGTRFASVDALMADLAD